MKNAYILKKTFHELWLKSSFHHLFFDVVICCCMLHNLIFKLEGRRHGHADFTIGGKDPHVFQSVSR